MKNFSTASTLILPNDRLTKAIFNLPADVYTKMSKINFNSTQSKFNSVVEWYKIFEFMTKAVNKFQPAEKIFTSFALLPPVAPPADPSTKASSEIAQKQSESKQSYEEKIASLSPKMREMLAIMKKSLDEKQAAQKIQAPAQNGNSAENAPQPADVPFNGVMSADDFYTPLNQFDKMILSACISEYEIGNAEISPAIIYRDIFGKQEGNTLKPTPKILDSIWKSIYKLAYTKLRIKVEGLKKLGYVGTEKNISTKWTPILPCEIVDGKIRGQNSKLIRLTGESPVQTACNARVKEKGKHKGDAQFLRIPRSVLDSGRNNSMDIALAKFYTACRALEIVKHKMNPSITAADIVDKCHLTNIQRTEKINRLIDAISATLDKLKTADGIKDFELNRQNGTFSVKIVL